MKNDRPIEDHKLQRALDEVKGIMARYGLAGACMLVSPQEAAYTYKLHAPWSAWRYEPSTPLGFRLRANEAEEGKATTLRRLDGAVHTVCQLSDFGSQTMDWMEQLKALMREAGLEFDHTPFNGKPLPGIVARPSKDDRA